jgi:hypothetical protein
MTSEDWIEICKDYRAMCDERDRIIENLQEENAILKKALEESRQTIEDVCIGQALECPDCGKFRPCLCHDKG